jgi:hypothetical protein
MYVKYRQSTFQIIYAAMWLSCKNKELQLFSDLAHGLIQVNHCYFSHSEPKRLFHWGTFEGGYSYRHRAYYSRDCRSRLSRYYLYPA